LPTGSNADALNLKGLWSATVSIQQLA
jgi:hypothetical protein